MPKLTGAKYAAKRCAKKVAIKNLKKAERFAANKSEQTGQTFRAHSCDICNLWHIFDETKAEQWKKDKPPSRKRRRQRYYENHPEKLREARRRYRANKRARDREGGVEADDSQGLSVVERVDQLGPQLPA